MLNLVIDIGNSRSKIAIFNRNELMINFPIDDFNSHHLEMIRTDHPNIEKAIVSSVKEKDPFISAKFQQLFKIGIELEQDTRIPIQNCYETPQTLGKDRLAAAVGANWLFPNENLLVIDAGTAITYDFVNDQNQYRGGFITPGLTMRLKALHHFTQKLPLLEPQFPQNFSGLNTFESIQGGVQYGLEGEIDRIIHFFKSEKQHFKVILTGGDANYFEKIVKCYNFVALELTLIGLNRILEFNHPG